MQEIYDRRTMPPIVPDTIPISSWGSSLFNLLTLEVMECGSSSRHRETRQPVPTVRPEPAEQAGRA